MTLVMQVRLAGSGTGKASVCSYLNIGQTFRTKVEDQKDEDRKGQFRAR